MNDEPEYRLDSEEDDLRAARGIFGCAIVITALVIMARIGYNWFTP